MWILALVGCATNIHELYEEEKAQVLKDPPPLSEPWEPDMHIRVGEEALERLVTKAVSSGLGKKQKKVHVDNPLGLDVWFRPKAKVKNLHLTPLERTKSCSACFRLSVKVGGEVQWGVGKLKGSLPLRAKAAGKVGFALDTEQGGWQLMGTVKDVGKLEVDSLVAGSVDVSGALKGWVQTALNEVPPLNLGSFGGEGNPLLALQAYTNASSEEGGASLHLRGRTDLPFEKSVAEPDWELDSDWELVLPEETVGVFARRHAFGLGLLEHDVALDPRGVGFENDAFVMDLRLWRLAGRGWWRDYDVNGTMAVQRGHVRLRSDNVEEGEKSRGAGIVDPLAFLAEGKILQAVEQGVHQSLPASKTTKVSSFRVMAEVEHIVGRDHHLVVTGSLTPQKARQKSVD